MEAALHHLVDVHAPRRHRQQAHGAEAGGPSADAVGDYEGLVSLLLRHPPQGAPGLVCGGVDPFLGSDLSIAPLQLRPEDAEGGGGLGGGARFGDHVDGEVPVPDDAEDIPHIVGAEVTAREVDLHAFFTELVAEGPFHEFQPCPGAQVAAADADDHQHLALLLDAPGRLLDPGKLLPVIGVGQVQPAQHLVPRTGVLAEDAEGILCQGADVLQLMAPQPRVLMIQLDGHVPHSSTIWSTEPTFSSGMALCST